eukprot:4633567-Pyramimonas_sp.AAC.1
MNIRSRMIRSTKAKAETISEASKRMLQEITKNDQHHNRILKIGKDADSILKTINKGKAKLLNITSGQAAIDEHRRQMEQQAEEERQRKQEMEDEVALARGEAPVARRRPAGATDHPLAAEFVPKGQRTGCA